MFDFGFGELLLLAIIALVVLGPERLPIAARLIGRWIRAARSQWNAVKSELENELADDELRRNLREASDAMREGAVKMRTLVEQPADSTRETTPAPAPELTPAQPAGNPVPHREDEAKHEAPEVSPESAVANAPPADEPAQLSLLAPDSKTAGPTPSAPRSRSDG